jgi:2-phospho-L-lactate transferase/gluconeogenesis factor (CofD/UPF0052 family)
MSLDADTQVRVVLFTGGRGSSVLSEELIKNDRVAITLAINGYDDGLSTGEVRRFLGDCLGPSDFRKNASRLASKLHTCDERLVPLLDLRFPDDYTLGQAAASFAALRGAGPTPTDGFHVRLAGLAQGLDAGAREALNRKLDRFEQELIRTGFPFSFADCSLGNLVFAGCFLDGGRDFNRAVDDYCALLGLRSGMVDNVTDGRNICLVAVDARGRLLATEAEIVAAGQPEDLAEIYLLDRAVTPAEQAELAGASAEAVLRFVAEHAVTPVANPRLLRQIEQADLIVYAPGTQHSSLFPSYLTPGIGAAIAKNLHAVKVLITNLQEDAEITGKSAVDLIDRALFYLRGKDRLAVPTPCLITHYLINEPGHAEPGKPYVPLGSLDSLEDPRMVRIGNYEEGMTGRHDATRVLAPFVEALLRRGERTHLAVLLHDADSLNKVGETIVEMVRAGVADLPVTLAVFYECPESFEDGFTALLPFDVRNLSARGASGAEAFRHIVGDPAFDYVLLFESSGMYKGEDIVNLTTQLRSGRLDAVWGSRRLSVNDIREAYQLIYRHRTVKSAVSYLGSHVLSLSYLFLFGRYISDTLSGARAVRTSFLQGDVPDYHSREFNQVVLTRLLRDRAEVFETPVFYLPISPQKVRRTSTREGLMALGTILRGWLRHPAKPSQSPDAAL